ncbi:MAG: zf-HC2 domain-containing protein [Acidimicrobiia bacterium]
MSHLEHFRYRRYLDAHVDGELSGPLRTRVADHVATCPMCGHRAELTLDMKNSLSRRRGRGGRAAENVRRWARRHLT